MRDQAPRARRYSVKKDKGVFIMTRRVAKPDRIAARSNGFRVDRRPARPA